MSKTLFTPKDGAHHPLPTVEEVGGKGYGLYWLAANRFPAPLTWVLSSDLFDLAVRRTGLTEAATAIGQALAHSPADWNAIQALINDLEPHRMALVEALQQLAEMDLVRTVLTSLPGQEQWAVRSSATVEDDPHHSFAGQFRSFLSVPRAELWTAICRVWASAYGREALSYCFQKRTTLPRMAVILQPMAPLTAQDRSGVAFSHSPVPSLPGVLIQVAFGSGPTVVGGHGGDLFSVAGAEVQVRPMPPDRILVTAPQGGLEPQATPAGPALSHEQARQLADLVQAVADRWGRPVNVEFVWQAGKGPLLTQVRSVATPAA